MTDYSPILHLPLVAPNQEQKETTINTALAILEAAMNDTFQVDIAAGNVTLTQDDFTRYFLFQVQAVYISPVERTITVPQTERWFAIENQSDTIVTVTTGVPGALELDIGAGKIALAVSDGADIRAVVPDPTSGIGLLTDLSDVSGSPTNGQLLRYVSSIQQWQPWTLVLAFSQLSDFPGAYSSNAGSLLAVKADGTGLEWVASAANVNSFIDLDDVPSSYTGAANRTVKVNSGATGLVFAQPRLTEAIDFPSSYTGQSGKFTKVSGSALVFAFPVVSDLSDGPGAPTVGDATKYIRVNVAGTALEYATGTGGPQTFLELSDTPADYTGDANKLVRVNPAADALVFDTLSYLDLEDGPSSYSGAGNRFLRVNSGATAVTFATAAIQDLSNGPGTPSLGVSKRVLRVNAAGNAVEYHPLAITDLSGFPSAFTGAGGKFLQVKLDESGVQFVNSSVSVSFLDLTDTPASYSGQANKLVVVNGAGNGITFQTQPFIPTLLSQLADVEGATGTPAENSVLTWKNGVWQAEPSASGGATTFLGLTDTPASYSGQANKLVVVNGAGTALTFQTQPFIPTLLSQLADVEGATGTPAENSVLTWKNGVWQAEPSAAGGSGTLEGLTDVNAALASDEQKHGRALTWDAAQGKWVPGLAVRPPAAEYWRVLITASQGSTVSCAGLRFYWDNDTNAEFFDSGVWTFIDGNTNGSFPVDNAFDGDNGTSWISNALTSGETYLGIQYTSRVRSIRSIDWRMQTGRTDGPTDLQVQFSSDGTNWTTAWRQTFAATWTGGTIRDSVYQVSNADDNLIRLEQLDNIQYATGRSPILNDVLVWYQDGADSANGYWTNSNIESLLPPTPNFVQLNDVSLNYDLNLPNTGFQNYDGMGDRILAVSKDETNIVALDVTPATLRTHPDTGAHEYWRIAVTSLNTTPAANDLLGVKYMEFRPIPNGPAHSTAGGTAFGSTPRSGHTLADAFDFNEESYISDFEPTVGTPVYLGMQFAAPVLVQEVMIQADNDFGPWNGNPPGEFEVQYSDDGSSWTTAMTVDSNLLYFWQFDQQHFFQDTSASSPVMSLRSLLDVPHSYEGQGLKVLRVRGDETGLEFAEGGVGGGGGASTLDQLEDVELGTGVPDPGAYLRYIDGVWQADPPPARTNIDIIVSKNGLLYNGQILATIPISRSVWLPDNFAGAQFSCLTNPSATTVIAVMKNGVQIGSVSINTSGVATFSTIGAGEESFTAGDVLRFDGPSSADATLADFGITIPGQRAV